MARGLTAAAEAPSAGEEWEGPVRAYWEGLGLSEPGVNRLLRTPKSHKYFKDVSKLVPRVEHFQRVLPNVDAARMISRRPGLLQLAAGEGEALEREFQELKDLLPWEDAEQLVNREPALLNHRKELMANNMQKLQELLPEADLKYMVYKQPVLILFPHETLVRHLQALRELLQGADVDKLVSKDPSLLCRAPITVKEKYRSLQKHAALVPRWEEQLRSWISEASGCLPSTLARALERHERLAYVAGLGEKEASTQSMYVILKNTPAYMKKRFPGWVPPDGTREKAVAWREARRAREARGQGRSA